MDVHGQALGLDSGSESHVIHKSDDKKCNGGHDSGASTASEASEAERLSFR